jgi:hypothetical protein
MPNLQYQTVGDNYVREAHQILNGIVRPMKDSFWNTHYPPNGWGCRCEAIQVPNGLAPITPKGNIPQSPVPQMFSTNLAKCGLIFPKGHPYYAGIPQSELRKAIAYLPPENTYVTVRNNPQVNVNLMHGKGEFLDNYRVMDTFINYKQDVKSAHFLPNIHEKDAHLKNKFLPANFTLRDMHKFKTMVAQSINLLQSRLTKSKNIRALEKKEQKQ